MLLGILGRLLDSGRDLVGLAISGCHSTFIVAHHNERVEAESSTTLDHGGTPSDLDDAIFQLVLSALTFAVAFSFSGHDSLP
jgi:hypothetical protein